MKSKFGAIPGRLHLGHMEYTWPKGLEPGSVKKSDSNASFGGSG